MSTDTAERVGERLAKIALSYSRFRERPVIRDAINALLCSGGLRECVEKLEQGADFDLSQSDEMRQANERVWLGIQLNAYQELCRAALSALLGDTQRQREDDDG